MRNFKHNLIQGYKQLLGILSWITPIKKNRIAFVRRSFSGCNVTLVYEKMKDLYPNLDLLLIDDILTPGKMGFSDTLSKARSYTSLISSKVIVTTHGALFKTKKNINLELWHAFPTKKSGLYLEKKTSKALTSYPDYFSSYSDFCTLLLNARYGMPIDKYVVFGAPRNDYLFQHVDDRYHDQYSKVILYAPTYRDSETKEGKQFTTIRLDQFSLDTFNQYLTEHNYLFLWKLHPNDELKWEHAGNDQMFSNINLLTDRILREMNLDFYQILPMTDLLITDYSSIYADYLLLDKPMIFISADLKRYNLERGLLLTPYEAWMPGPKCTTLESLQDEIVQCLDNSAYYEKERAFLRNIFHQYQDGTSTERVIQFILSKMELPI